MLEDAATAWRYLYDSRTATVGDLALESPPDTAGPISTLVIGKNPHLITYRSLTRQTMARSFSGEGKPATAAFHLFSGNHFLIVGGLGTGIFPSFFIRVSTVFRATK